MNKYLWQILVPTVSTKTGRPIRTRQHKSWDKEVVKISGGLTIDMPSKGQWINPDGRMFSERMIPVKIMCSEQEICQIADFTAKFYDQEAIMFYRISDKVVIKHYKEQK